MVLQRALVVVVTAILSAFTLLLLLVDDESWAGPVIWTISPTHGLHLADLPILGLWLVGIAAGVALCRDPRTPVDS